MKEAPARTRLWWYLGGALGVAALFAVCSTRSSWTAQAPVDRLVIGQVMPLSGPTADWGRSATRGVELAAADIRRDLGIDVEVVPAEDNQGRAASSADAVRRLVSLRGAKVIIGPITSDNARAAAIAADELSIPLISPAATAANFTRDSRFAFRACYVDDFQGRVLADFAATALAAKVAVVMSDPTDAYSQGLAQSFVDRFTTRGGRVERLSISLADRDFGPQLARVPTDSTAGIVFIAAKYPEAAALVRQLRTSGRFIPLLAGDAVDSPEFFKLAGDKATGVYVTSHFAVESTDSVTSRFVREYTTRFGEPPDVAAALSYDAALLAGHAFSAQKERSLRDAMVALRDIHGVTGRISFDETRNPIKSVVILKAATGRFVFVSRVDP